MDGAVDGPVLARKEGLEAEDEAASPGSRSNGREKERVDVIVECEVSLSVAGTRDKAGRQRNVAGRDASESRETTVLSVRHPRVNQFHSVKNRCEDREVDEEVLEFHFICGKRSQDAYYSRFEGNWEHYS